MVFLFFRVGRWVLMYLRFMLVLVIRRLENVQVIELDCVHIQILARGIFGLPDQPMDEKVISRLVIRVRRVCALAGGPKDWFRVVMVITEQPDTPQLRLVMVNLTLEERE